jgi:hypothetical protein
MRGELRMTRWLEGAVVLTDRVLEHGLVAVDGSRIAGGQCTSRTRRLSWGVKA